MSNQSNEDNTPVSTYNNPDTHDNDNGSIDNNPNCNGGNYINGNTNEAISNTLQSITSKCSEDWLYCLFFTIALVFYIIIAITSSFYTSTEIFYPYDEDGNICGHGSLSDYDKLYFYDLANKENKEQLNKRVCVSDCPVMHNGLLKCHPTANNTQCLIEKEAFYSSKQFYHYCVSMDYDIKKHHHYYQLEPFDVLIEKIFNNNWMIYLLMGIELSTPYFLFMPLIVLLASIAFILMTLFFSKATYISMIVIDITSISFVSLFLIQFIVYLFSIAFFFKATLFCLSFIPLLLFICLFYNYSSAYQDSILDIHTNSLWKYHIHISIIVSLSLFLIYSLILLTSHSILINLLSKINGSLPLASSMFPTSDLYQSLNLSLATILQMTYVILFTMFISVLLSQIGKYIYAQYAFMTLYSSNQCALKNLLIAVWILIRSHFGSVLWMSYRSVYLQFSITNCISPNRKETYAYLIKYGKCLMMNTVYNRQYIRIGLTVMSSIAVIGYFAVLNKAIVGVHVSFVLWLFVSLPIAKWILSFPASYNDVINFEKEFATAIPVYELASLRV